MDEPHLSYVSTLTCFSVWPQKKTRRQEIFLVNNLKYLIAMYRKLLTHQPRTMTNVVQKMSNVSGLKNAGIYLHSNTTAPDVVGFISLDCFKLCVGSRWFYQNVRLSHTKKQTNIQTDCVIFLKEAHVTCICSGESVDDRDTFSLSSYHLQSRALTFSRTVPLFV